MKNLYIIRHARSKLCREDQEDHDRELNKTGKIEASISGKWINNFDGSVNIYRILMGLAPFESE